MARRRHVGGQWSDVCRGQLRDAADNTGQEFGVNNIRSRRRDAITGHGLYDDTIARNWNLAGKDFDSATMPMAEAAWSDLKGELLAEVADPTELWGYRRFELQTANQN